MFELARDAQHYLLNILSQSGNYVAYFTTFSEIFSSQNAHYLANPKRAQAYGDARTPS